MKKISGLGVFFMALFACFSQVYAAQGLNKHWEFAGWYGGGCYPNLAFDPHIKDRVYLTSDVAGLWRSDDLGENWRFITKGLGHLMVAQVAIAPSDSNVLYAATGGGVFVSKNAGESWSPANNQDESIVFSRPDNYRPIAIDPASPNRICVGTAKGKVFCSINAGSQWTDLDPQKQIFKDEIPIAAVSFDKNRRLYVAYSKGLGVCPLNANGCQNISNSPSKITDFTISKKHPPPSSPSMPK